MIILSFCLFLLMFVVIGALSTLKHKSTNEDYLLAGQNVKPWLVALSAIATYNSGYMFVGQIGYTYMYGLSSIWLMIGWIVGDFLASLFIHKKLRTVSEDQSALTYAGVLSKWFGENLPVARIVGGIITLLFLGAYAAAQLTAGGKALHVLFHWDYSVGVILGSAIVLLYCFAGGIRASIWTDAAQSFVMIIAMGLLCYEATQATGGISGFITQLQNISPSYLNLFPQNLHFGPWIGAVLFLGGWLFAGFGVVGQPHVMVRFMSMDNPKHMNRTRAYYYFWYLSFFLLTIAVGFAARILIPEVNSFDPELALPTLSQQLLPDVLVGLVLAGLFAATMSTADSQILSCSAALSRDILPAKHMKYIYTKLATVVVAAIALAIALWSHESVFQLVLISSGALASAFAPVLTVLVLGYKLSETLMITMMLSGIGGMLLWRTTGFNDTIYEIMPGILAGFLVFLIAKCFCSIPKPVVQSKQS